EGSRRAGARRRESEWHNHHLSPKKPRSTGTSALTFLPPSINRTSTAKSTTEGLPGARAGGRGCGGATAGQVGLLRHESTSAHPPPMLFTLCSGAFALFLRRANHASLGPAVLLC